jgi:hypothetical protein
MVAFCFDVSRCHMWCIDLHLVPTKPTPFELLMQGHHIATIEYFFMDDWDVSKVRMLNLFHISHYVHMHGSI